MASKREKEERLQTWDEDHCGGFDVKDENKRGVEGAKTVQKEPLTKTAVPEYFLSFSEILP